MDTRTVFALLGAAALVVAIFSFGTPAIRRLFLKPETRAAIEDGRYESANADTKFLKLWIEPKGWLGSLLGPIEDCESVVESVSLDGTNLTGQASIRTQWGGENRGLGTRNIHHKAPQVEVSIRFHHLDNEILLGRLN